MAIEHIYYSFLNTDAFLLCHVSSYTVIVQLLNCLHFQILFTKCSINIIHKGKCIIHCQWLTTSASIISTIISSYLFKYLQSFFFFFLGATNSIFKCYGLLNIWFPLITILDAANPILYSQFLHVISYVIFPSVLWSPLWLYWYWFPLIYFLFYHSLFRHSV